MKIFTRRNFLRRGAIGLTVIAGGVPVLISGTAPTEKNVDSFSIMFLCLPRLLKRVHPPESSLSLL